ncbi:MAG: FtsX-like permease family protein [Bdellovibrionaceae bacterium]|nr:FtsX-like permease family protein [Pseudobdellovibrionaceae bacterium]
MSFYFFRRYFLSSRAGSLIKIISWLCLAGVTVSITALILIVSIMGGFGEAIKSRLLSKQAHLTIYFDKNPFSFKKLDGLKIKFLFPNLTQEQSARIKSSHIFETQELILKSKQGFKGVSAIGYSDDKWNKELENSLKDSEDFQNTYIPPTIPYAPNRKLEKEILLSHELSLETGLSIHDTISFIPLTGLLLPPNLPPPIKSFKVRAILPPSEKLKDNFSIYYKQGLMDFGDFSKVSYKAELQLKDPEKSKEYQQLFKNYKTTTWIEQNSNLFFALKLEKFIMTLFLILAFIISCLGISSALLLLMTQKKSDIAILRAMGSSQKEIVRIFTRIGFFLSSLGIVIGFSIGIFGTFLLKHNHFNLLPEMYQDRTIPAVFMPFNYIIILTGALILSWFFCRLPSQYFSRIETVELLKTSES